MTEPPIRDFKVTPLSGISQKRYEIHCFNGKLTETCTRATQGCHFKWPWVTWVIWLNIQWHEVLRGLSATAELLVWPWHLTSKACHCVVSLVDVFAVCIEGFNIVCHPLIHYDTCCTEINVALTFDLLSSKLPCFVSLSIGNSSTKFELAVTFCSWLTSPCEMEEWSAFVASWQTVDKCEVGKCIQDTVLPICSKNRTGQWILKMWAIKNGAAFLGYPVFWKFIVTNRCRKERHTWQK